jgi:uncharacterized membrane protein
MQVVTGFEPYTGPRPAPARRWAPWTAATAALLVIGNAVLLVLNLMERRLLTQSKSANPPSRAEITDALGRIHTVSVLMTFALLAFVVVGVTWERKRRSRTRVAQDGETGVEARLRTVWPAGYVVLYAVLAFGLGATLFASTARHNAVTADDFIRYRTFLAAGHATRAVFWSFWIALVLRATQFQEQREAATATPPFAGSYPPPLS